jgi:hypothetical protein
LAGSAPLITEQGDTFARFSNYGADTTSPRLECVRGTANGG